MQHSPILVQESNTNQKTSQLSKDRIKIRWVLEGKGRPLVAKEATSQSSSTNRRTRNSIISIKTKENKTSVKEVVNMQVITNTHTIKKETKIK